MTGCVQYRVIETENRIIPLEEGESLIAPFRGYYIPDSRMKQILEALDKKALEE